MHELSTKIDEMKARWMVGGTADAACPDDWRQALGDKPNVALVAMAGQFTRVATRPSTGTLSVRAPLPRLALPVLAAELRPMFRRILDSKSVPALPVLTLMEARGVTAHPADWMPGATTEVPDVYGPWIDWVAEDGGSSDHDDVLSVENWDDWFPHARRAALVDLRRTAPDAARDLIAAKAGDVPAEQRLRLVAVLQDGLSVRDAEVLGGLISDRSGKVSALAKRMLARLGRSQADAEAVAELAEFFETQTAGLLRRKQIVVARKLKTNAQRKRRRDLAQGVPLSTLAQALNVDPDTLVRTFELSDGPAEDLVAMTAATGSEAQVTSLLERIVECPELADLDILPLTERLDGSHLTDTTTRIAKADKSAFQQTRDMLAAQLGTLPADSVLTAPAFSTLMKQLAKDDGRTAQQANLALTNLGLITNADAADRLLRHFTTSAGLMAADPRLALLRLNVALKETP